MNTPGRGTLPSKGPERDKIMLYSRNQKVQGAWRGERRKEKESRMRKENLAEDLRVIS